MKPRKCSNWLHTLIEYVEETESPRDFWLWSGLFCLSSAMQRKCWIPFGMENLYPNLYIMLVAPPGKCRKGPPVGFAKKILSDKGIQVPVFVDSPTKRALTKFLSEVGGSSGFHIKDEHGHPQYQAQSPCALVSKELSSFLAIDSKAMIEVLTDLFDSHDTWEYKTSEKGTDKIFGVCITGFFATTPTWFANNLPEEAVGGGFTARVVVVPGFEKYKLVSIPQEGDPRLYQDLITDLARIRNLAGEFKWDPGALTRYDRWYKTIGEKVRNTHDERMHAYLERMHIMAIKTSMCLHVAQKDSLIIEDEDMRQAIGLVELVLDNAPQAFGSLGRSTTSQLVDELRRQIRVTRSISFKELMRINYHNIRNRTELREALETLEDMGQIKQTPVYDNGKEEVQINWIPRKERYK